MPHSLALLLCTAFVLVLLRVERLSSRGVSAALWVPTVWLLFVNSKSLAIWFGVTGSNESGSLSDQLLLVGLSVTGLAVVALRRFNCSAALRRHGWLLVILIYMFLSTLWSDITAIAFRRWAREVILVIMALVTMSEASPHQALESLLRRSAYILMPFSLMLIRYYPALGREYTRWSGKETWIGVTSQKNSLASLCVISAFFLLWSLYCRWRSKARAGRHYQAWADFSVLLIALYLLKGAENAYSATSIGTLVVGIATFLAMISLRRARIAVPRAGLLAFVALIIAFGASQPFLGGSIVAPFSAAFGRDTTLTGRTDTWKDLVPVVERHPLLGCGFGSFWTTTRRELYQMSNAHNGYLDTLLELGAVGLMFFAAWLLSCSRKLHGVLAQDYDRATLAICLLLMMLVLNTTESTLNDLGQSMTAVVALVCLVVPYKPRSMLASRAGRTPEPCIRLDGGALGTAFNCTK